MELDKDIVSKVILIIGLIFIIVLVINCFDKYTSPEKYGYIVNAEAESGESQIRLLNILFRWNMMASYFYRFVIIIALILKIFRKTISKKVIGLYLLELVLIWGVIISIQLLSRF